LYKQTNKNFGSSIVAHLFIPQRVNSATTASSFITVQQRLRKSFFSEEKMSFSEEKMSFSEEKDTFSSAIHFFFARKQNK